MKWECLGRCVGGDYGLLHCKIHVLFSSVDFRWCIPLLLKCSTIKGGTMWWGGTLQPGDTLLNQGTLQNDKGWTGKDVSPSPTLGTIIKKSYDGSSVLFRFQFRFKNSEQHLLLGSGGNQNLRPSCRRPPTRIFHPPPPPRRYSQAWRTCTGPSLQSQWWQ